MFIKDFCWPSHTFCFSKWHSRLFLPRLNCSSRENKRTTPLEQTGRLQWPSIKSIPRWQPGSGSCFSFSGGFFQAQGTAKWHGTGFFHSSWLLCKDILSLKQAKVIFCCVFNVRAVHLYLSVLFYLMVVKNILVKTQFFEKLLLGSENQFISFVSEQGVRDRRTLGSLSMSVI